MKSPLLAVGFTIVALTGSALAQEFRAAPRVAPEPEPQRPSVEQNSGTDIYRKFRNARNKAQLLNPLAPREYGSGEQVVMADQRDPRERPRFWRLFSVAF
ncbi:MAG TPA: hypothetical protein VGD78_06285 [Chthoniobacterales bacterium]